MVKKEESLAVALVSMFVNRRGVCRDSDRQEHKNAQESHKYTTQTLTFKNTLNLSVSLLRARSLSPSLHPLSLALPPSLSLSLSLPPSLSLSL